MIPRTWKVNGLFCNYMYNITIKLIKSSIFYRLFLIFLDLHINIYSKVKDCD